MTEARCAAHPDDPAIDTCSRCGRFLCLGCRLNLEGRSYCAACGQRVATGWSAPGRRSSWALGLGVLGVFGLCFPAMLAASMAAIGLGVPVLRTGRGAAGAGNHRRALAAVVLGALGMIGGAVSAYYFARRLGTW